MILRYIGKRIWRLKIQALILIALTLIFSLLLLYLNESLGVQRQKREEAMVNIPVRCIVTDQRGEQTERLYISGLVYNNCVREDGHLYPYIDKIFLRASFAFNLQSLKQNQQSLANLNLPAGDRSIVSLTRLEGERNLETVYGAEVHFLPGYSEEFFRDTSRYYCLLPWSIYELVQEGLISAELLLNGYGEPVTMECEFEIIGYYLGGGGDIYCNWQVAQDIFASSLEPDYADSLSFILKDNHKLEEFKAVANQYFVRTGSEPSAITLHSLVIQDQQLNATIFSLDRNIRLMQILLPLLNLMAIGIGFFVGYIYIRNRKQEFAVMASLGTGKKRVFSLVFLEQALLGLTGIALGLLAYWLRQQEFALQHLGISFGLFTCFTGGAAIAILRVLSLPVMAMLTTE